MGVIKNSYEDLLKYMKLLEEGCPLTYIHKKYGINKSKLHFFWLKYKAEGSSALQYHTYSHVKSELKEDVVRDYLENHLSLVEIMLKYNVSEMSVLKWSRLVCEKGYASLYCSRSNQHNIGKMARPKKKEPQTELEKLQMEVLRLRAENALLKKVKALVDAREARLRKIGQKPSND